MGASLASSRLQHWQLYFNILAYVGPGRQAGGLIRGKTRKSLTGCARGRVVRTSYIPQKPIQATTRTRESSKIARVPSKHTAAL